MRVSTLTFLVALALGFHVKGARIYFSDQPAGGPGYLVSVAPDGTDQRTVTVISNAPDLRGVAFHRASGRIYFLDNGTAKSIYSILPDGSDQQETVPVSATLINSDLEIDEGSGKIYWSEANAGTTGNGFIRRANLNGTAAEPVVTTAPGVATSPYFFFLDPVGGYIYWGVLSSGSVSSSYRRATFAGEVDETFLITSPTRTRDIAVDAASGTAYWCDRQTGNLYQRPLSGGANQILIGGMNAPHGIALDLEAGKVYWADTGARGNPPSGLSPRRVARCNLDGSEFENLSTPLINSEPWDLALDLSSPTYDDWRTRFFSVSTPEAGPEDDADGDGAKNLLEYAMGTHPRRASSRPAIALAGTSVNYIRRIGSELQYRVEVSTNLPAFQYNGDGGGLVWTIETSATPVSQDLESVSVAPGPALATASNVFYRVRASLPE
jgi:hypothetical protein